MYNITTVTASIVIAEDINECETAGGNVVCGVQQGAGVCRNKVNSFACDCNAGYTLKDASNPSSACGKSLSFKKVRYFFLISQTLYFFVSWLLRYL